MCNLVNLFTLKLKNTDLSKERMFGLNRTRKQAAAINF